MRAPPPSEKSLRIKNVRMGLGVGEAGCHSVSSQPREKGPGEPPRAPSPGTLQPPLAAGNRPAIPGTPDGQSSVCDPRRGYTKAPKSDFTSGLLEPLRPAARAWGVGTGIPPCQCGPQEDGDPPRADPGLRVSQRQHTDIWGWSGFWRGLAAGLSCVLQGVKGTLGLDPRCQKHPIPSCDENVSRLARHPLDKTCPYLHDKGVQPVALAPGRVQLSKHHRVRSRLAQIANPELGGFEIRGMYDEFLHEGKK